MRALDGSANSHDVSSTSPLRISVPATIPGTWVAHVEGIDVQSARLPYILTVSYETNPRVPSVGQRVVLPFYLICEASAAMADHIGDLNTALRTIQQNLSSDANLNKVVMLGVISFNDTASSLAPLAPASEIKLPHLRGVGASSYSAAIREFHRAFEQDRVRLTGEGARLFRPCVFFVTHSAPSDADHAQTFRTLLGYNPATQQGNKSYPNVVAIGLPGAPRSVVSGLAYPNFGDLDKRGRWFLADATTPVPQAWASIAEGIRQSITSAYAGAVQGSSKFTPPVAIPGTIGGVAGQDT
jgi:uncharacterized protein YegL